MSSLPSRQRQPARTDPDLRAIGLLALALVIAAALAGMIWSRSLGRYGALHGGEVIGATLAPAGTDMVVVNSVRMDGAAQRGGLQVGDVIEAVGGTAVPTVDAADHAFLGQRLDIRVRRGKREIDLHLDATGGAPLEQQDPVDRG